MTGGQLGHLLNSTSNASSGIINIHPTIAGCHRKWPQLDLFIPMQAHNKNHPRYYEFETSFLRTFLFFWPLQQSNTSLTVLYDEEKASWPCVRDVRSTLDGVRTEGRVTGGVSFQPIKQSSFYKGGYDRQQYSMFWADNYTSSEYIGFCDTDTAFITYVDLYDLFEDSRPVVNARGPWHKAGDGVSAWSAGTYRALGILEPFNCMSYFPVVVKAAHLKELREYMVRHHNFTGSFDDIFRDVVQAGSYSQFSIMCAYLYTYRRSEYKWYVRMELPGWSGTHPAPHPGQSPNVSDISAPELLVPKPLIATHVGHRRCPGTLIPNIGKHRVIFNLFMQAGVCISPPFPRNESVCQNTTADLDGFYFEMHNFDYINFVPLNSAGVLKEQFQQRQARLAGCNHTWDAHEIHMIMKPVENMTHGGFG